MMHPIKVKKLRENAVIPTYGSSEAAGADLYACLQEPVTIMPGQTAFIPTGLSMELPVGYAGLIYARSGLACKRGLAPANKVGVIDSDYRGEFIVALYNHGDEPQRARNGYVGCRYRHRPHAAAMHRRLQHRQLELAVCIRSTIPIPHQ